MSKINVPLVEVTIRRDANTITPVTVPPHELTLLRQMFGKENVSEAKEVGTVELSAADEHERLSAKYGPQKIAKVYGDDDGTRLTNEQAIDNITQFKKSLREAVAQYFAKRGV